jgi:hypothetical protein
MAFGSSNSIGHWDEMLQKTRISTAQRMMQVEASAPLLRAGN